jgi:hypothetical protein
MSTGAGPCSHAATVFVFPMQPRVLIICERAVERDTIRVLVGTMGCQWVLASNVEEAIAILGRERTSAALLELPGGTSDPDRMHQNLRELLARFPGRVIVMTEETPTPGIKELITRYTIPCVQRDRLTIDLWPCLESMVYPQLGVRRVTRVARLILDTFLRPLPAGIRFVQPDTRQLVYEAQSLTADISFERPADSTRTVLLGQIMRTNEPQLPLNGVPVVLKGRRGRLGLKMTNESGEFSFEFQDERSVTLEIEVSPNDWVVILSPPLDWGGSGEHQKVSAPGGVEPYKTFGGNVSGKKGR